jgi:hypothetical protein
MNSLAMPADPLDLPVFVLGERAPAMQLIGALAATPAFCAMPANRLLHDLLVAVEHSYAGIAPLEELERGGQRPPATWYREVQAAQAHRTGKPRTVEFSGLAVRRLNHLFPRAQFLVVHELARAIPRSRRLPPVPPGCILEVGSETCGTDDTLERVLAFLGEGVQDIVVDLADPPTAPADHDSRRV